jgi:hypothetical protein
MEIGSLSRPATAPAPNALQRADPAAPAGAVRTELAPEAAVQPVGDAAAVRLDLSDDARSRAALDQALAETIARRIEIDPKTREVVYQTVDRETGEVVRQVPDQALMRLRAYAREMRALRDADADAQRVERIA